jgi:transketolase
VLVLSADLTASCEADGFRDAYPERFFSLGMAEQNMMGFAAGLAREGFFPYIHTFAVFITRRPFDQVAMSIAYPNLPVRLIGFLPGITTPGGVTHQAIDDIGLMRLIPNMTVLEAATPPMWNRCWTSPRPSTGRSTCANCAARCRGCSRPNSPCSSAAPEALGEGDDLCVLSSGICTEEAMRATAALRNAASASHTCTSRR